MDGGRPLRDLEEHHDWIERESPSVAALSSQPEDEVRAAALAAEVEEHPVRVWYRYCYATGAVDIVAVTNR